MTIIKFILVGLAAVMFLALVKKVFSMSSPVGKNEPFVIMSPFEATITKGGKPVANTQVKLNYSWNSGSTEEQEGFEVLFNTDTGGKVRMPAIERNIFMSNLQTTTANYSIKVRLEGEEVVIHSIGKVDPKLHGELDTPATKFSCELEDPLKVIVDPRDHDGTLYTTRCKTDVFNQFQQVEI